ncbi:MAG: VanZ family protein, partial [Acidobacteria bacterium]|nr:VanZ family protein [Acidobacteriota bacterium]
GFAILAEPVRAFLSSHLPTLLWSVVVAILLLAPGDFDSEAPVWLDRLMELGGDKLIHAALFFVQAIVVGRTLRRSVPAAPALWLAALVAALYGLALELAQRGIAGRGLEAADIVANTVGAVAWPLVARGFGRGSGQVD